MSIDLLSGNLDKSCREIDYQIGANNDCESDYKALYSAISAAHKTIINNACLL